MNIETIYIPHAKLKQTFNQILIKYGFPLQKAELCAGIFADNSLDGIYSHGVNRFARFIEYIQNGYIDVTGEPVKTFSFAGTERWNGNLGPGPLNALFCTDRAIRLADQNGISCIGLANTNHWMCAGYYGRHAAHKGYMLIAFTNTLPNMPAWGATDNKLGNNPLVIAVPAKENPIVLDMAMSQFSFGKLEIHARQNIELPVYGGYNKENKFTADAKEILDAQRTLPIGYWKGGGLSLLLDLLTTILSGGNSVKDIAKNPAEFNVSQTFVAIKPGQTDVEKYELLIKDIITDYKSAKTTGEHELLYPGERVLNTRNTNTQKGIPVEKPIWDKILKL